MTRFMQYEMTAGQWAAQNPVLLKGEVGWESGSPPKAKKGDGVTPWNGLLYAVTPGAPIASPTFTGDPKAPTPLTSDNDTSIATTAFVKAAIAALIAGSPALLDTLDELAAALGDDPNFAATMATQLGLKAPLASPTFTGDPKAPTPATSDNDTSIATSAFVKAVVASYAPLASPALTGNPTAPTASATDNDTSVATTAHVKSAINQSFQVIQVPTGSGSTNSAAALNLAVSLPWTPRCVVITVNNSALYAAADYANTTSTSIRIIFRTLTTAGAPGLANTDPGAYAVVAYA